MSERAPGVFLDDAVELARLGCWSESVYADLLAVGRGDLTREAFDEKYRVVRSVLVLDITGFTVTTMHGGALSSFLRILDTQRVGFPVLERFGARGIHGFADDIVAVFDEVEPALDAAFALHDAVATHVSSTGAHAEPPECCIGIGFGTFYEIGPNLAMGDEMNRASKLGEDIARGGETLVTEGAREALARRADVRFEAVSGDDLLFPYFRASRR